MRWRLVVLLLGAFIAALGLSLLALSQTRDDGALERIRVRGILHVGMDASFPPFAWLDRDGAPVGYEVELAEHIAAQIGVRAQISNIAFDSLYDALQAGRVDIIISELTYDERRTRDVIYSPPYFDGGQLLIARALTEEGRGCEIEHLSQLLHGRRVAVEWGSAGDMQVRQLQGKPARYFVLPYPSAEESLAALVSGEADVAIVDAVSAHQFMATHPNQLRMVCHLTHEPYVIATSARSPRLAEAIRAALETLQREGVLDRLRERWLSTALASP